MFDFRETRRVKQCCSQVVHFKIGVVLQNLFGCHAACEQFQQSRHRIAQAADNGLAVADVGVAGDTA
jgi:hypothetical protein